MRFRVDASVGNADGVFDAAYEFGASTEEAVMRGTPADIGAEVTRYLASLRPEDCQAMHYGSGDFFVRLTIRPDEMQPIE